VIGAKTIRISRWRLENNAGNLDCAAFTEEKVSSLSQKWCACLRSNFFPIPENLFYIVQNNFPKKEIALAERVHSTDLFRRESPLAQPAPSTGYFRGGGAGAATPRPEFYIAGSKEFFCALLRSSPSLSLPF
jgi:hypothetical protein